jgi:hypothetical protein
MCAEVANSSEGESYITARSPSDPVAANHLPAENPEALAFKGLPTIVKGSKSANCRNRAAA